MSQIWKVARAVLAFFVSQLVKLLALATFFPAGDGGEHFQLVPVSVRGTVVEEYSS